MTAPVIKVESVGKRYRLGEQGRSEMLTETLGNAIRAPLSWVTRRGTARKSHESKEDFWALRDVSLAVNEGEVVGLIGANGAGKSTLLKLLSRITLPTEGRIELRGRVATLLEVGTGFHPELTGRENIYLNGTILGMRRREIDRLYSDIVEFSGIEPFITTPVKRYSSGMYVRLAFAVAAHLQPEILLVDEVLAVGDAEFQKKCLGKMREVAEGGRTIVFVSHNLSALQRLCQRAFWIEHGRLMEEGPSQTVVANYLKTVAPEQRGGVSIIADDAPRTGSQEARLRRVAILDAEGQPIDRVHIGQPFSIALRFEVTTPFEDACVEIGILAGDGTRVATALNIDRDRQPFAFTPGTREVRAYLNVTMLPGQFTLDVALHHVGGLTVDWVERTLTFTALNVAEEGADHYPWPAVRGSIRPESDWTVLPDVASEPASVIVE